MTLVELFDRSLSGASDREALEWLGKVYTFGDLEDRSNRVANLLIKRGIRKGDRIAVYLANRIEIIDIYIACLKIGAVFVPINILYRDTEIDHIMKDAEPSALISDRDPGVPSFWPLERVTRDSSGMSSSRPDSETADSDAAAIVYTSGTTGKSKGVVLTHRNFAVNATNLIREWQISADERFLCALPLFHVHGLGNGIHPWLVAGYRMRLLERFNRSTIEKEMLEFRPTLFFGVPTMYVRLLEIGEEAAKEIGEAMRLFVSGSAPLPARVFREFEHRYGHRILERYGMTETLMNLGNPLDGPRISGTVGRPMPGVETRIVDTEGNEVECGRTGELLVRGENVFAGYWRREDASRESFIDGWFRTGDLAERRDDGFFVLHGRLREVIITSGFKLLPREVEELILTQPGVREVAVVGLPDATKGEIPAAFVVCEDALDSGALEDVCRKKLASFKVPKKWIQIDSLPRNALGKVQKHKLQALAVSP